jgi:hypothetical protein
MSSVAVEGALAARVSKLIREGETVGALALLEEQVDGSLVLYSGFVEHKESPFDRTGTATRVRRVMETVARHRAAQAAVADDAAVRETINATLASLQPQPR